MLGFAGGQFDWSDAGTPGTRRRGHDYVSDAFSQHIRCDRDALGSRAAHPGVSKQRPCPTAPLLDCIAELQDAERAIDGRLRPGRSIALNYLDAMLEDCRRYAGQIFVLEVYGAMAGFTTVFARVPFERLDEPPGDCALVAELLVRREYRRRGYARALLAHGERYAASQGAAELRIGVLSGNTAARALYLDFGFMPYVETLSKSPSQR